MTLRELLKNLKLKSLRIVLTLESFERGEDKDVYIGTIGTLIHWKGLPDYLDLIVDVIHTDTNCMIVFLTYE